MIKYTILLFLFLFSIDSYCLSPVIYTDINQSTKILGPQLLLLEDTQDALSFSDIKNSNLFQPITKQVLNLPITKSSFWIKFHIKNLTEEENLILLVDYSSLDYVEYYTSESNGKYLKTTISEALPFNSRKYKFPTKLFDLRLKKDQTKTCFLKVRSYEPIMLPLKVGSISIILEALVKKDFLIGIYVGLILVMIIFNLFIYYKVREVSSLYYVIFILLVGLCQISLHGYPSQYLWPEIPWLTINGLGLVVPLSGIAGIKFFQVFLQTKKHTPVLDKFSIIFYVMYIFSIGLVLSKQNYLGYKISELNVAFLCAYLLYTSTVISLKGYRPAKFYLFAYSIFLCGVIIFVLKDLDILPYNDFTFNTMMIGSGIEIILLSFALADRMYVLKKENEDKQVEIIKHLRDNEQYLKASQELALNAERLKKEVIASEFESLKNQVNPHFLFNSLNVLTELVYQNQGQATKFIKELSEVYRYVLDNKNKEVVELKTEYEFIKAFVFLLKIRFDKNLNVNIELPIDSKIMIAPLTLQLLIENAIKHNIISEDEPLTIDIFLEDHYLTVRNNIQKKKTASNSTGLGLKNIVSRYQFLSDKKIIFSEDSNFFIVKIPTLFLEKIHL